MKVVTLIFRYLSRFFYRSLLGWLPLFGELLWQNSGWCSLEPLSSWWAYRYTVGAIQPGQTRRSLPNRFTLISVSNEKTSLKVSDCLIGINLYYAPVPYSQVGGVNDKMFTPCVINDKICSKDTIAVSLNFLEFLPIPPPRSGSWPRTTSHNTSSLLRRWWPRMVSGIRLNDTALCFSYSINWNWNCS